MTAHPAHIAHVCVPAAAGGLERVVELLSAEQRRQGHAATIIAVLPGDAPDPPLLARAASAGVAAERVRVAPHAYAEERRAVRDALARVHPEVVHTHGYRADVLHAGVAHAMGLPVVTTLHGFTGGGWKNRGYEWLQRLACRRMDGVVAVSRPIEDRVARAGVQRERLACIPNAYPPVAGGLGRRAARARLGVPADACVVGWVGRLSREKGADLFVDMVAQLREFPLLGVMIGEGPERAAVEARAALRGAGDRVHFAGIQPDAAALFPAFDAFVLSSRTEGTPVVLFEAMAARVPIVATTVGGVPDVLRASDALLVPPDASQLAAALARVLANPEASQRRAASAALRLEETYAVAPWAARYDDVYRRVLAASPAR